MFVKESIEDILQPKTKSEIKGAVSKMDVEQKEKLLFETGMSHFYGSYDDFLEFLDETLSETGIWTFLTDLYNQSAFDESPFADNDDNLVFSKEDLMKKMGSMDLVEMMLSSLSEESIDLALSKLVPGYLSEGIGEVLKPKSQEEIRENVEELLLPKTEDEMRESIRKLDLMQKYSLIEELWGEDWEAFADDIRRYMGDWKFEDMIGDMIYMKQNGQI